MQFRETSDGLQKCANFVLIPGMLIGAVLKTSKHQNFKICYNSLCIKLLFVASCWFRQDLNMAWWNWGRYQVQTCHKMMSRLTYTFTAQYSNKMHLYLVKDTETSNIQTFQRNVKYHQVNACCSADLGCGIWKLDIKLVSHQFQQFWNILCILKNFPVFVKRKEKCSIWSLEAKCSGFLSNP